ncbi:fluoride efflux transporter CrcB [Ornithinimicrobium faecis]|uniref:fluoride efflux transporter CrcB n=1 Tax=Ornithinimicrobium faecis TaxID=2934158 RepID=UPI002118FA09|nr:fluoride efflux transporter CrcB [Ornithinimicrobium sp. HY1745]
MSLSPLLLLGLALLGGVGAATRYLVDDLISRRWHHGFPLATLVINVTGSFLIGLLAATLATGSPEVFAVLATGFCGGYTTFSTATVEAVRLAREGDWRRAALAAAGTLVLCTAAATLGYLLGGTLR